MGERMGGDVPMCFTVVFVCWNPPIYTSIGDQKAICLGTVKDFRVSVVSFHEVISFNFMERTILLTYCLFTCTLAILYDPFFIVSAIDGLPIPLVTVTIEGIDQVSQVTGAVTFGQQNINLRGKPMKLTPQLGVPFLERDGIPFNPGF